MVLTLFISEDKRDEFAGTAWPFDSLLEHTNQGGFSSDVRGTEPGDSPLPAGPWGTGPAQPQFPGQVDDPWSERWPLAPRDLALRVLSREPPAGGRAGRPGSPLTWAPSESGLNCGPGRPRGDLGRQHSHRAPASPGLGGTWQGWPAARFLHGRGGKTVLEGPRAS